MNISLFSDSSRSKEKSSSSSISFTVCAVTNPLVGNKEFLRRVDLLRGTKPLLDAVVVILTVFLLFFGRIILWNKIDFSFRNKFDIVFINCSILFSNFFGSVILFLGMLSILFLEFSFISFLIKGFLLVLILVLLLILSFFCFCFGFLGCFEIVFNF